jgi:hypothetical protein
VPRLKLLTKLVALLPLEFILNLDSTRLVDILLNGSNNLETNVSNEILGAAEAFIMQTKRFVHDLV